MKKLNNLVKLLLLAVVAITLFVLAVVIINTASKKTNRFAEYSTTPYNDDIAINVQVIETRQNPKESSYKYEYSKYDVYLYVSKKTPENVEKREISEIYTYLCSKSGNKYGYTQTQTSKKMSEGSYSTSTMSMLNSTTAFAYFNVITDENGKVTSVDDRKPEEMYVKVTYKVKSTDFVHDDKGNKIEIKDEDDNPTGEFKTEEKNFSNELNYKFSFKDLNIKDFKNYEKREVSGSNVSSKNDLFKLGVYLTVKEAEDNKGPYDNFKVNKLETNADKMEANVFIENIYLSIVGEISNEGMISKDYFNKYVQLFVYTGSLARSVSAIRTSTILSEYKINKLYVTAEVKTTNNKTYTTKYYLDVSELTVS